MQPQTLAYRPFMTRAGLAPTHPVQAIDEYGECRDGLIAGESPLTIKVDKLYDVRPSPVALRQSTVYGLLAAITEYNDIYRAAGAVHGCALCQDTRILTFIEDVGRHNAADAISGMMWLDDIDCGDKIFYTVGRLTSEIVMKCAHMGMPVLLLRSDLTHMGYGLAQELGMTLIAHAKGRHFLVYSGAGDFIFDAPPERRPLAASQGRS